MSAGTQRWMIEIHRALQDMATSKCKSLNVICRLVNICTTVVFTMLSAEKGVNRKSLTQFSRPVIDRRYCLSLPPLHGKTLWTAYLSACRGDSCQKGIFYCQRKSLKFLHHGWGSSPQPYCVSPFVLPSILTPVFLRLNWKIVIEVTCV